MKDEIASNGLFQKESLFWSPEYVDTSAWIEHVPFAFWIIEIIKPKIVVELGVHNGTSYFSFCQAVKKLNLTTACYGVDKWEGDEHAGFYGEEVFSKVLNYNTKEFSRFSTLLRSSFDEAKDYFTNGSIDFLHIDGLHTYEAVKHDFETWLPRLSAGAFVMFHDINVRERGFGVFQLWEELKQQYQNFQFDFGHGLGIISLGNITQNELKPLVKNRNEEYYIFLRNLFSERGKFFKTSLDYSLALSHEKSNAESLRTDYTKLSARENELSKDNKEVRESYKLLESIHQQLNDKYLELINDNKEVRESYRLLESAHQQLNQKYLELAKNNQEEKENYKFFEATIRQLKEAHAIIIKDNNELRKANNVIKEASDELSKKWEMSAKDNEGLAKRSTELQLQNTKLQERYDLDIAEYLSKLSRADSIAVAFSNEMEKVRNDYEHLRKGLEWYKATYEDRSLIGVIKEKTKSRFKKFYLGIIDSFLKSKRIREKYGVVFCLEYIKENGINYSLKRAINLFKKDGFKNFSRTSLRRKAIEKLNSKKEIWVSSPVATVNWDEIKDDLARLKYQPTISIVFPTYNTRPSLLEAAIKSVKDQIYTNWELCIADDHSTDKATLGVLKNYKKEPNIKIVFSNVNKGISEATNAAIGLSTGDYIALMDHDDEITPDALYWVVKKINENRDADILYSDECKVDEAGNLSDFFFKPQWSPELLINMMYIGHLTVYRKDFLNEVGLFRKEYDFSQDYDLVLRATEKTDKIFHIDKVIYHWRITEGSASQGDKPYARISNLAALRDAAARRNIKGEIIELPVANRLKIEVKNGTKVSIIIPTDSYKNLKDSIESVKQSTSYAHYEIVPVTNSALIEKMKGEGFLEGISYVAYDKAYNFSDKCNTGAAHCDGEIVIFFNDDVRPLQEDWIENTIEFLQIPDIGGVSPKLIYENDTIQYAGMAAGVRNLTGTTFHNYHKDSTEYINFPQLVRNVSILCGACIAMRKDIFLQVNGFDGVNTPIAHSDVDLSFRILEAGLRCVYTPYATLRHIGHLSLKTYNEQEKKNNKDEADIFLLKRWGKYIGDDKYFTVPMRNHVYRDSPEPYQVFASSKSYDEMTKGNILLVSHDLSVSGAPLMLYNISKIFRELGYFVTIVSPQNGPLQKMYAGNDVPVIVDELVLRQHSSFERFSKNFDIIICNTILAWPAVRQMQDITKTIWWMHEGEVLNSFLNSEEVVDTLKKAKNIVGVSDYSISFLRPYSDNISKIYNYCSEVKETGVDYPKKEKIVFSIIGSVERRKGHDILINALGKIRPEEMQKAEIWIIGRVLDKHFLDEILPEINKLENVKLFGEKSHAECLELMKQSDVILSTSRDDPFPLVLVEAFCLGKTCIVSTNSGVAELIQDNVNGYIFESENVEELAKKIMLIINNSDVLDRIGKQCRKVYEKYLTAEVAKKSWTLYINKAKV